MQFQKKKLNFSDYQKLLSLTVRSINLSYDDYINFINIIFDFYNPINNFCSKRETENILLKGNINKKNCYIPMILPDKIKKNNDSFIKLIYEKKTVGIILKKENFSIDKKKYLKSVFSSYSKEHPGVKKIINLKNNFVAGPIFYCEKNLLNDQIFKTYKKYVKKKNFLKKYIVFSTRNISHLGHQELHKNIVKKNKLAICLIVTSLNKYSIPFIEKSYLELKKHYIYKNIFLFRLFLPQMYAGPKEAFLQATIFKNFGFKGFAVGRDHAGVKKFYKKYQSQVFIKKYKDFKLKIMSFKEQYICKNCLTVLFKSKTRKYCKDKKKKICNIVPLKGGKVLDLYKKKDLENLKIYLNPILSKFIKKKMLQYV